MTIVASQIKHISKGLQDKHAKLRKFKHELKSSTIVDKALNIPELVDDAKLVSKNLEGLSMKKITYASMSK